MEKEYSLADVDIWQRDVDHQDDQPELGPTNYLFETSTAAFSALLQLLAADAHSLNTENYAGLRNEFRKFYLWNEGFSTRSGSLDHVLSCSKNLKATVLGLMVNWAKALSKVPKMMPECDWSAIFPIFHALEVSIHKTDQVAKAAVIDMKSQYSIISVLNEEYDFDSDSETDSVLSEDTLEDIVEDLNVYMESLADLSLSLNHPATDSVIIEAAAVTLADGLLSVPEHVRPFALIINDRFPSLDTGFVRKLGETNWQRRERLRAKLASAPAFDENAFNNDDDSSTDVTVVDPNHSVAPSQQSSDSNLRSSMSHPSTHQTITTASGFSEPSIFDNQSRSIQISRPQTAQSVTSFATSLTDELEHGQRRIPNLPENHDYGSAFQCTICGEILTQVRNRADWKTHVYNDLEPYVCLFTDCSLGLQTFKSRREWMNHEFQLHRVTTRWACSLCKAAFDSKQLLRSHIADSHSHHFAASQIEEMVAASKRTLPCTVLNELCPFCLTAPAQTQKGFASHVGKHQQEISLAALPRWDDTSGSDRDDDGDDSDDSDDDDKKSSKPIRSSFSTNTLDYLSFGKEGRSEPRRLPFPSNIRHKSILDGDSAKYANIESRIDPLDQNSQTLKTDSVAFSTLSHSISLGAMCQKLDQLLLQTAESCQLIINGLQKYDNKRLYQDHEVHSMPALWASSLRKSVTKLKYIVSNIPVHRWTISDSIYRTSINVLETYLSRSDNLQKALSEELLTQDSKRTTKRLTRLFRAKPELEIERKSRSLQAEARKAAQGLLDSLTSEQISEMELELDDNKWHDDPRIRGTMVHDFSFPRPPRKNDRDESNSDASTSKPSNPKEARKDVPSVLSSDDATLQSTTVAEISEGKSSSNSEKYSSLATQLYDAVEGENLDQVVKLLLSEIYLIRNSIDRPGGHHGTALHAAAYYDNESVVKLLLQHGADVNANCGYYGTALQAAAASTVGRLDKCSTSMIELLIQRGADVNAKGGYYGTALQAAAASLRPNEFQKRAVQHLLDQGADVNATGGHYHTALQAAAANGSTELLQLLLKRGADISIKGGYYGTALIAAAGLNGNSETLIKYGTQTVHQDIQTPKDSGSSTGIFQGEIAIRSIVGTSRSPWYVRLLSINNRGELSSWENSPSHSKVTPKAWEFILDLRGCSVESLAASPENGIESDIFMICDSENIPILELNPKSTEDPYLWFQALSHWKDISRTDQVNQLYKNELDHWKKQSYLSKNFSLPDSRWYAEIEDSGGVVVKRELTIVSTTKVEDQGRDGEQKSEQPSLLNRLRKIADENSKPLPALPQIDEYVKFGGHYKPKRGSDQADFESSPDPSMVKMPEGHKHPEGYEDFAFRCKFCGELTPQGHNCPRSDQPTTGGLKNTLKRHESSPYFPGRPEPYSPSDFIPGYISIDPKTLSKPVSSSSSIRSEETVPPMDVLSSERFPENIKRPINKQHISGPRLIHSSSPFRPRED